MSTRTRSRPSNRSYAARLQERAAAARRPRPDWLTWLTAARPAAVLALVAECGHLAAALVEWPAAPLRGLAHVLIAAALGLLAVSVYFGPSMATVWCGLVLAAALPIAWIARAPLYQECPLWTRWVLSVVALGLAGVLGARLAAQRG